MPHEDEPRLLGDSIMMLRLIPMVLLVSASGCPYITDNSDGSCSSKDMRASTMADMTPPVAACGAAQGLAGDNLLCVDFSNPQVTVSGLTGQGWFFEMDANCPGWTITSGSLQVTNFAGFMGTCQIKLPALSAADYQKYNSFTLSMVHTVDLNAAKQGAYVYLGLAMPSQQLWYTTGTNPPQTSVSVVTKANLPNGGSNAYQPLLEIFSNFPGGFSGWLIDSIAINATQ
jgi:hypothetical protein